MRCALEQCGEFLEMKPPAVGSILRALGLSTKRLGASGRRIILLNSVRRRIHRLADNYKVLGADIREEQCAQCDELYHKEPYEAHDEQDLSDRLSRMTSDQLEDSFG